MNAIRLVAALFLLDTACAAAPTAPSTASPSPAALPAEAPRQTVDREVLRHAMPREFGDDSGVTLVEVTYPPGGSTRPHRHPCPVVAYVVDGSIRMQVQGGAERVYQTGEAFYEDPADVHLISANGSSKTAAKFVAFFVCRDHPPLTVPVAPAR
jgi:quercetin dioxygenase-like cupin family protein